MNLELLHISECAILYISLQNSPVISVEKLPVEIKK